MLKDGSIDRGYVGFGEVKQSASCSMMGETMHPPRSTASSLGTGSDIRTRFLSMDKWKLCSHLSRSVRDIHRIWRKIFIYSPITTVGVTQSAFLVRLYVFYLWKSKYKCITVLVESMMYVLMRSNTFEFVKKLY